MGKVSYKFQLILGCLVKWFVLHFQRIVLKVIWFHINFGKIDLCRSVKKFFCPYTVHNWLLILKTSVKNLTSCHYIRANIVSVILLILLGQNSEVEFYPWPFFSQDSRKEFYPRILLGQDPGKKTYPRILLSWDSEKGYYPRILFGRDSGKEFYSAILLGQDSGKKYCFRLALKKLYIFHFQSPENLEIQKARILEKSKSLRNT